MGIHGIPNRTENWITAKHFVPLLNDKKALLRLITALNQTDTSGEDDVELELFWKGIRDRRFLFNNDDEKRKFERELVTLYKKTFEGLWEKIDAFKGFKPLKGVNYRVNDEASEKRLINNLLNTEIDIVMRTRDHLYIGEAKRACGFGSDSRNLLVHQLVRQFVVARLIVEYQGLNLCIKPFVILDKHPNPKRYPTQLRFLICQGWMPAGNVLTWNDLPSRI